MKRLIILASLTAIGLVAAAGSASAQGYYRDEDPGYSEGYDGPPPPRYHRWHRPPPPYGWHRRHAWDDDEDRVPPRLPYGWRHPHVFGSEPGSFVHPD